MRNFFEWHQLTFQHGRPFDALNFLRIFCLNDVFALLQSQFSSSSAEPPQYAQSQRVLDAPIPTHDGPQYEQQLAGTVALHEPTPHATRDARNSSASAIFLASQLISLLQAVAKTKMPGK